MTTRANSLFDANEIARTLELLVEPGQVVEVRTLNATTYASPRYPYQASGYFDDTDQLVEALTDLKNAKGVYITLQPCRRELLARAHNRLRSAEEMRADKSSTSDQHILRYRWLLLDCDPDRPAGISSSEEEHTLALAHAEHIKTTLSQRGWPDPIMADSGNGAHLLYSIDLCVDESDLVKRVLERLATRFDLPHIHLDQKVFNPSRISKLYGTLACKGDNTPDRPHRMSCLLSVPDQLICVSREQLEAVATPKQQTSGLLTQMRQTSSSFDLDAWIAKHGLDLIGPSPWKDGGRRWIFPVCPWNSEHTDKSAYIVQHENGAIAAGCQHNSCRGKGWRDLRALYEPDLPPKLCSIAELDIPEVDLPLIQKCLRENEWGDGLLFARLFRDRCVYDHTAKKWYLWRGHAWKRDEIWQMRQLVSGVLASVYTNAANSLYAQVDALVPEDTGEVDLKKKTKEDQEQKEQQEALKKTAGTFLSRAHDLRALSRNSNILTFAGSTEHMGIVSTQWDTHPWLLATPDGVLDLRTGEMSPGRPADYIRTVIPTHWQGLDAPAPRFLRFLREIFADRSEYEREELIAFLQRTFGYGITGHVFEHVFLSLLGAEGRNGKDTFLKALSDVLDALVGPISNDVIIATGRALSPGAAKPHLCALQGKRIAWASETDKGERFDIGQVKFLSGGGAIPARQLHGEEFTFQPSHLLILLTNNKPHADAEDKAFWDRMCPILFRMRFVANPTLPCDRTKDTTLGEALKQEASGILAWLVRGCLDWQQQGLCIPNSVLRERAAYQQEEDTLGHFLNECCVTGQDRQVKAKDLYVAYKLWAQENNLKRSLTGVSFGIAIKKRYSARHTKQGNVYVGLSLIGQQRFLSNLSTETDDLDLDLDTPF